MPWFAPLVTKEFVDYFKNEDSVYFEVTVKGKRYNKIFKKFTWAVRELSLVASLDMNGPLYNAIRQRLSDAYRDEELIRKIKEIKFNEIYHTIEGNVFNCDISALNADQLAVGLIFPFMSRMDGSFEDKFAQSGRLREFILALHAKTV